MNVPDWAVVPSPAQLPGCVFLLSPHHSRDQPLPPEKVRYIVLHGTASGSSGFALFRMMDPHNPTEPSAHFLVTEVGEALCLVPLNLVAWHAGRSGWAGEDELNPMSIAIEIQNDGVSPYTPKQIETTKRLLRFLLDYFQLPPSAVLGHSDVSPHRKEDPFPHFFWKELEEAGLAAPWVHKPGLTLWQAILERGYRYGPGTLQGGVPVGHSLRKSKDNADERVEVTAEHILKTVQRRFGLAVTGSFDEQTVRFLRAA